MVSTGIVRDAYEDPVASVSFAGCSEKMAITRARLIAGCSEKVALTRARLIAAAPETAAERDRLSVVNAQLRELNAHLLGVLKKMKRIIESPEFRAVEDAASIHGVEYRGKEITQPDLNNAIRKAEGEHK